MSTDESGPFGEPFGEAEPPVETGREDALRQFHTRLDEVEQRLGAARTQRAKHAAQLKQQRLRRHAAGTPEARARTNQATRELQLAVRIEHERVQKLKAEAAHLRELIGRLPALRRRDRLRRFVRLLFTPVEDDPSWARPSAAIPPFLLALGLGGLSCLTLLITGWEAVQSAGERGVLTIAWIRGVANGGLFGWMVGFAWFYVYGRSSPKGAAATLVGALAGAVVTGWPLPVLPLANELGSWDSTMGGIAGGALFASCSFIKAPIGPRGRRRLGLAVGLFAGPAFAHIATETQRLDVILLIIGLVLGPPLGLLLCWLGGRVGRTVLLGFAGSGLHIVLIVVFSIQTMDFAEFGLIFWGLVGYCLGSARDDWVLELDTEPEH